MQCNFRITQSVEFDGPFGNLDVHNAYDLMSCKVSDDGRVLCLAFRGNEYRLEGRPEEFEVRFGGVQLLEMNGVAGNLSHIVIDEVGFISEGERDYRWALDDGEPGPNKHLIIKAEASDPAGAVGDPVLIRVSATTAEVIIVGGRPPPD